MYQYRQSGLDTVWLKNGFEMEYMEGGAAVSIHNVDGLHEAIGRSVAAKNGFLTPQEFRFLRIELELSQKAIGVLMGKTEQAVAKWEKDEVELPKLADKAIRDLYLESLGEPVIAGLLQKLAEVDRQYHESRLEFQETPDGWSGEVAIAA